MTDHTELASTLAEMTGGFERRRDAIAAALDAAAVRGVKPLEWHKESVGRWLGGDADGMFYWIYWHPTLKGSARYVTIRDAGANGGLYEGSDFEAAKAAAQADYEARILSALVLPPRSPNEQETET